MTTLKRQDAVPQGRRRKNRGWTQIHADADDSQSAFICVYLRLLFSSCLDVLPFWRSIEADGKRILPLALQQSLPIQNHIDLRHVRAIHRGLDHHQPSVDGVDREVVQFPVELAET